jgi:glycosyltransferase involved in cell wall biosynthesis
VERDHAGALSQAISGLLQDRELRTRWANSAADWAQKKFSYAKNATAYLALYESLLKG